MTRQLFNWAPCLPGPWDSMLLACAACGATLGELEMEHAPDCAWLVHLPGQPLTDALLKLYDIVWNKTGTVDLSGIIEGYNGISYADDIAIEEACKAVEDILTGNDRKE